MAIVLASNVGVFDQGFALTGNPAVIELHDDDTFLLARIDPATNAKTETILNVPLTQLDVSGARALLTFAANGIRRRVDFSAESRALGMIPGVAGMIAQTTMIDKSGIRQWVDTLRSRGVKVRYITQGQRFLITAGVVIVILAIAITAITISALSSPN